MEAIRERRALAILAEIGTGALSPEHFAPGARWWWNGGLDVPLTEFGDLLARLHGETEAGIAVAPGLVIEGDEVVMVEATSHAALTNGRVYDNRYVFLFAFDGVLVRQVREYSDSAHVLATFDLG